MQITAQINANASYTIQGDVLLQMLHHTAIAAVEAYIEKHKVVEDEIMDSAAVMKYIGISSRATLIRYENRKKNNLKRIPGSPKRYFKSDVDAFLQANKI